MALAAPSEGSSTISLSIYKPLKGVDIEDAVVHLTGLVSSPAQGIDANIAIIKSLNGKWVAVVTVWRLGASNPDRDPSVVKFFRNTNEFVRLVDSGYFRLSCREQKDVPFTKLSMGDIVSVRRIYGYGREKHEVLAYCCLAVLKSYFTEIEGIRSYTFYESMDFKQIVGLGIWSGIECACTLSDYRKGSRAEAYWRGLGAEKLKYEVCQVVHVLCTP